LLIASARLLGMESSLDQLTQGRAASVVGTVLTPEALTQAASLDDAACHVVEIRLDGAGMQDTDWTRAAKAIRESGKAVILTVRLERDGGHWPDADEAGRLSLLEAGLQHASTIDIEIQSSLMEELRDRAVAAGKPIIVSYHDFDGTPDVESLHEIVSTSRGPSQGVVCKIATMTETPDAVARLEQLLAECSDIPTAILGMGALGTETRARFPSLGSRLTYGYLDRPAAPGQLSARELVERLTT
jgi:3-dehydroquinate dehydratase-1